MGTTIRNVFVSTNGILHVATEDQPNDGMLYTVGTVGKGSKEGRIVGASRCLRKSALTPAGVLIRENGTAGTYHPDAPHV